MCYGCTPTPSVDGGKRDPSVEHSYKKGDYHTTPVRITTLKPPPFLVGLIDTEVDGWEYPTQPGHWDFQDYDAHTISTFIDNVVSNASQPGGKNHEALRMVSEHMRWRWVPQDTTDTPDDCALIGSIGAHDVVTMSSADRMDMVVPGVNRGSDHTHTTVELPWDVDGKQDDLFFHYMLILIDHRHLL